MARVLVVQPREALALATCRQLHFAGIETALVFDGDSAVRHAVVEAPDAVVCDLTLPVLDGWYVLAALGAREHGPRIVVYSHPSDASRATALGADAVVHERARVVPAVGHLLAPVPL